MESAIQPIRSKFFDRWWAVAMICGLIRLFALMATPDSFEEDTDAYWSLAKSWHATGTFGLVQLDGTAKPTAYRPPLYPWILSWFAGTDAINQLALAVIHLVLGTATCVLGWSIAKEFLIETRTESKSNRWFTNAAAWGVGLSIAIDPILVRQSALVMTETLATMLSTLVWWSWVRLYAIYGSFPKKVGFLIGVMLGLYCLSRSTGLVWWLLLIMLWLVGCNYYGEPKKQLKPIGFALFLFLGGMLVLAPWAIRNQVVLGKMIWTTSHGGYTLLLANNPILFEHYETEGLGRDWDESRFHEWWAQAVAKEGAATELDLDRHANAFAWRAIREHPIGFAYGCIARFGWFWSFWPAQSNTKSTLVIGAVGAWYGCTTLVFAIATIGSLLRNQRFFDPRWFPAVALVVGLVGVHLVYWSNMRMRAPLIPVVYVVGATFFSRFVNRSRRS